ncbi:MAG: diguanylate cyclase [Spirochaetales bacterium]|nr:diguanylate cyclase [Spirochaetales bacterium]
MNYKKHISIMAFLWIIIVAISLFLNYQDSVGEKKRLAMVSAKSFFDQVLLSREWNAYHGGVYAPVTDETPPNPYLDVELRDLETDGLKLTKLNPSYMTRQMAELAMKKIGVQIHLTSLNPIRPQNIATSIEENALYDFEKGIDEVGIFVKENSNTSFFYMAPLITETACLQCHAKQGYEEGDIRGGISITLPFVMKLPIFPLLATHIGLAIIGLSGILLFGKKLDNSYEIMKKQASIDSLTNIPNRRSFLQTIELELKRCNRDKQPLAAIICDLDNFKDYNDNYGHVEGDLCLQKVAQKMKETLKRPGDFCARYGGEEFVIILPGTPLEGAIEISEKIRKGVEDIKIEHIKSLPSGTVTLSLGIAITNINNPVSSWKELIKNADTALYKAKELGRNQVKVFNFSK